MHMPAIPTRKRLWTAVALALHSSGIELDPSATEVLRQFVVAGDLRLDETRANASRSTPAYVKVLLESDEIFDRATPPDPDTVLEAAAFGAGMRVFAQVAPIANRSGSMTDASMRALLEGLCPLWPFCL
jgi:hypothetical protein